MSLNRYARRQVYAAVNAISGATCSKVTRKKTCFNFLEFVQFLAVPLLTIRDASFDQVCAYIEFKKSPLPSAKHKALSTASLHNVISMIRTTMKALGADPDYLGITTKNLGVPPKSRKGTKVPITDEVFFHAISTAQASGEFGYAIMLKLERYFGHRGQEALMSPAQTREYLADLSDLVRLGEIDLGAPGGCVLPEMRVIDGTKSGRPRVTASIAKYAKESLEVLLEACSYLQTHEFFLVGPGGTLKSARSKMHRLARKCGLIGKYAPHSLRYRYACDKVEELRDAGWDADDTFKLATHYLGHGPSRAAALIKQVYCQTVAHTVPSKKKKRDLDNEAQELRELIARVYARGVSPIQPAPKLPD
jgi:Integrase